MQNIIIVYESLDIPRNLGEDLFFIPLVGDTTQEIEWIDNFALAAYFPHYRIAVFLHGTTANSKIVH
jgi:hypothetical protein